MNPCCDKLKEKYSKLEAARNALRQGVKIQNELIDKLQNENLNLKKASEEGRVQADVERHEKEKESAFRICLENEVCSLKSEILQLQQSGSSESQDLDVGTKINQLNELLEKERIRADMESKKAEAEKKEANKAWKIVEAEKIRVIEERRLADIERKKSEENGIQLEKLKAEAKKKREVERQNLVKEKKLADSEMAKAEEQRNLAKMYEKKAIDEECRANNLSQQLQEHKQRIEKLQKEMDEQVSSTKLVKMPADLSGKERKTEIAPGSGLLFEMLEREIDEPRLVSKDTTEKKNEHIKEQERKAIREKRRADSVVKKAEEHRILAETNKKKAMEEKHRADQLVQQLEDSRRRIEGLQNEILELAFSRKLVKAPLVPPDMCTRSETAKMKLLKEQLKFKKKQLKHAKEVAKLEISRNKILQQELHRLKQDCVQFLHHLDLLKNCFSDCSKGKDDQAKSGNILNAPNITLKRKLFTKGSRQVHLHCNNNTDSSDFMKQAIDSSAQLLPFAVGNCAQRTSGIDSKMEPLLRGSNRKMLQSSALNSSMSSFSDGPLLGSQERGALSVMTSAIVSGEKSKSKSQSNISSLSGEVTRTECIDSVGRKVAQNKKRKRIMDAVKSIEHLYSEGKNWQLRIEEELSMLHGMLNSQMGKSLQKEQSMISNLECHPITLRARAHKKKKIPHEEVALKNLCDSNGRKDMQRGEVKVFNDLMGDFDKGNLGSYEEMEGNYMKLLDLENAVDEERYLKAIQAPLSPTFPTIEFHNESFEIDNAKGLVDESSCEVFLSEKANEGLSCKIDVNKETESDKWKSGTSETSLIRPLIKNGDIRDSFENNAHHSHEMHDSHAERGMPDTYSSGYKGENIPCQSALVHTCHDIHRFCVVFSDTKDCSSMSRMLRATRTCLSQFSSIFQTDLLVQNIMPALFSIGDLSHKEKACVFFSVLLNQIFVDALEKFKNFLSSDSILFLETFAGYMHTVVSDMQTRRMLAKLCTLGELLILIEDFLIDKRILVYSDISSHSLPLCGSRFNIFLEGEEVHLVYETAHMHQLVSGSILLAALCAVIDHNGFLCEASYNIFRMHKLDTSLVLTILHVFAYVCGSKYLNRKYCGLIMTVMKSLVSFLEKENIGSDSTSRLEFPTCSQCPFSMDSVSLEIVVSSLLEELQNYALSGTVNQDPNEVVNSLEFASLSSNEKAEKSWSLERELNHEPMICGASCCLIKLDMPTTLLSSVRDGNVCHLSDIISLLELVACNVSWDWTCNNIVHELLKLLESSDQDNFFAVTVILVGKLGRLRVDANGFEDRDVENLRCRLSSFLCLRKLSLPSQISIVNALLGLLSLKFDELMKGSVELPAVVSPSNPAADCIREWYTRLSNKQQSLSFSLVQYASVSCCTAIVS